MFPVLQIETFPLAAWGNVTSIVEVQLYTIFGGNSAATHFGVKLHYEQKSNVSPTLVETQLPPNL